MKRVFCVGALALSILLTLPRSAAADLTAFYGFSPTPEKRSTKGIAIGISLLIVGFEFEYGKTSEDESEAAPGLTTGMGNVMVMTPTYKVQLYGTIGGGVFHESYRDRGTTSFGTNFGGGVKFALVGPLRARIDYRVFNLRGDPLFKNVQRFYGGVSLSF
jgi:hypothetical protein